MQTRTFALVTVVTVLAGCGGAGSKATLPAVQPADICGVLPLGDVQTIFPTAAPGLAVQSATSSDTWMEECDWSDSTPGGAQQVTLVVYGALTSAGDGQLDVALQLSGDGAELSMPVGHVGDQAVYAQFAGPYDVHQSLGARSGSYWVTLTAWNFPLACADPQLNPLVNEAIGDL
jgi:hypothetical protein